MRRLQRSPRLPIRLLSGVRSECASQAHCCTCPVSSHGPRSDFANGFLVAEILSRYYKSDISLHSFDNGLGLVKRIENWALIDKFLRKIGSPIDRNIIDQVIHCKKDAAIPLMEQLYTLLTHKTSVAAVTASATRNGWHRSQPAIWICMQSQSLLALHALSQPVPRCLRTAAFAPLSTPCSIQATRPVRDVEVVPAFARPTASQLIKERMSEADLAQANTLDHSVAPGKAAKVLAEHMQKLKLEREIDPARFQPKPIAASASSTIKHAPRKSVGEGTFREVTVRQVDDKGAVLQSRANHANHARSPSQQSARSTAPASPSHAAGAAAQAASPTAAAAASSHAHSSSFSATSAAANGGKASLSALSSALVHVLGPASADLLASSSATGGKESILLFAEGDILRLGDAHAAHVVAAVSAQVGPYLADQALSNPKEFWQTCGVYFTLLDRLPHDSLAFASAISAFSSLGLGLVSRDPGTSTELWFDFAFSKYAHLLRGQSRKAFQAAKVAYAFIGDSPEQH